MSLCLSQIHFGGVFIMSISRIITTHEFNQMQSYKLLVDNHEKKQAIKVKLLQPIREHFADKWFRMKKETRKAIDYIAWFASERGFAFPSYEHIAEKYNLSTRTLERAVSDLKAAGILYVVYRRNPSGNSKKNPVILFKNHQYFSYWVNLLNLDVEDHVGEGNRETSWGTRVKSTKKVSTNHLTKYNTYKDIRKDGSLDHSYSPSYIPERFVNVVKSFYDDAKTIDKLWKSAGLATKKIAGLMFPESATDMIVDAFKQAIYQTHKNKRNAVQVDFGGYFYGTLCRMLTEHQRQIHIEDNPLLNGSWLQA